MFFLINDVLSLVSLFRRPSDSPLGRLASLARAHDPLLFVERSRGRVATSLRYVCDKIVTFCCLPRLIISTVDSLNRHGDAARSRLARSIDRFPAFEPNLDLDFRWESRGGRATRRGPERRRLPFGKIRVQRRTPPGCYI